MESEMYKELTFKEPTSTVKSIESDLIEKENFLERTQEKYNQIKSERENLQKKVDSLDKAREESIKSLLTYLRDDIKDLDMDSNNKIIKLTDTIEDKGGKIGELKPNLAEKKADEKAHKQIKKNAEIEVKKIRKEMKRRGKSTKKEAKRQEKFIKKQKKIQSEINAISLSNLHIQTIFKDGKRKEVINLLNFIYESVKILPDIKKALNDLSQLSYDNMVSKEDIDEITIDLTKHLIDSKIKNIEKASNLINDYREECGLSPLTIEPILKQSKAKSVNAITVADGIIKDQDPVYLPQIEDKGKKLQMDTIEDVNSILNEMEEDYISFSKKGSKKAQKSFIEKGKRVTIKIEIRSNIELESNEAWVLGEVGKARRIINGRIMRIAVSVKNTKQGELRLIKNKKEALKIINAFRKRFKFKQLNIEKYLKKN